MSKSVMHEPRVEAAPAGAQSGVRAIAGLLRRNGRRIALLFAGMLLPLWIFAELADEVHELEQFVFDDPILLRAHAFAGPGLDHFFLLVSRIGYEGVAVIDLLIVVSVLAMRRWREATFAAVAFVGSALLNLGAKQFFQRHRPTLWESISPEGTFSFPSGHAMGSMTLAATVVLLAWPTRARWPMIALMVAFTWLVGYSRIYLGVHFPSDILAGWMAGAAWVVAAYLALFHRVLHPWQERGGQPPQR
ncbi:PAP2 family protein [Pseudoxanthomonas gei]|uniref:undecaprenyl-diphosphate phosphatase n=2 Tax=Pseudoxanthomonas gei TaxID=1383030 RepID=A0ABX0A9U0_9GAMM|nr:phosphatase PAP2 family protein [Pseudoxanthomonas gei]NDK37668.1 PAP2 family protein [Pseudoxanthomonas gei]